MPLQLGEFPLPPSLPSPLLQPLPLLLNLSSLVPPSVVSPFSTRILQSLRNVVVIRLQHNVLVPEKQRRKKEIEHESVNSRKRLRLYASYSRIGKNVLVSLERLR